MVIVNYFMFIVILAVATGVYLSVKIPTVNSRPYFVFLGITGLIAQVLMTGAFEIGFAHIISAYKFVEVNFSLTFGLHSLLNLFFLKPLGYGYYHLGIVFQWFFNKRKV